MSTDIAVLHELGPFAELALGTSERRDLRSDHAGETGAVAIYRGLLAVTRDPVLIDFAEHHLDTELTHLAFFERWLPQAEHSRLLPLWRLSGWLLGALPAVFGRRWVFATIAAVETFVVEHYQDQLDRFPRDSAQQRLLLAQLAEFQADEAEHQHDAEQRYAEAPLPLRLWQRLVDAGSRSAVHAARWL
ncbi:MAG: demethoxyubiquinone hydroxylase family protein [Pseudomonadota bacterium]